MAYRQTYKGNPELKQYYLVNDFSGGLDTVSLDEKMSDNTLREACNIDLAVQGAITNRKGFGELGNLNRFLEDHSIILPTTRANFFKIVTDEGQVLTKANDYNTYSDYVTAMEVGKYDLKILMNYTVDNNVSNAVYVEPAYVATTTNLEYITSNAFDSELFDGLDIQDIVAEEGPIRVLVKNQTIVSENGMYRMSDTGLMTKIEAESVEGTVVDVLNGDTLGGKTLICNTDLSWTEVNQGVTVHFALLEISNTLGTSAGITTTFTDVMTVVGTLVDTYNPNTTQYVQNIYFMTSDVYDTEDTTKLGIAYFNLDDNTLNIINSTNAYVPTPYEASNTEIGFNVLREDPLNDVSKQGFGDYELLGVYYTDENGSNIKYAPSSGNFDIRVFQLGETMSPRHIKLELKDQNDDDISYTLEDQVDNGGTFVYSIRNASLEGVTFINIYLTQREPIDALAFYCDDDHIYKGDELVIGGKYDLEHALNVTVTTSILRPNFYLTKLATSSTYDFTLDVSTEEIVRPSIQEVYHLIVGAYSGTYEGTISYCYPDNMTTGVLRVTERYGYSYYQITTTTNQNVFLKVGGTGIKQVVLPKESTTALKIGDLLKYNLDYYFYARVSNTVISFINTVEPNYFTSFTTTIYTGEGTTVDIKPLELVGTHMQQIQERLVLYKGNTIYFSEYAQFNYIPSSNFIILPLASTDEITRIYYFRGVYIIFTKETIWRLSGTLSTDADSDLVLTKVNDFIGCIAPNSVRSVNNNLLFLSAQGLYQLTQNYYQEGLENVKKVDTYINDLMTRDSDSYSLMYKEQYWLLPTTSEYSSFKYYFNLTSANSTHPFVTDKYTVKPDNLEVLNNVIYSLKNGSFYRFDKGYTDFLPRIVLESEEDDYLYTYKFVTKNEDLGYPTHDKKVKALFLKVRSSTIAQLGISIYVNEQLVLSPSSFETTLNDLGELVYTEVYNPNLVTRPVSPLGSYRVSVDSLGDRQIEVHKLVLGRKGKNFSIEVEQKTNGEFNLEDLGYLYKLGKVKESR